jgi:hypothetical protein
MKPTEYEFTKADGTKFYEIVCDRKDLHIFQKMHSAVSAKPVQHAPEGDRQ